MTLGWIGKIHPDISPIPSVIFTEGLKVRVCTRFLILVAFEVRIFKKQWFPLMNDVRHWHDYAVMKQTWNSWLKPESVARFFSQMTFSKQNSRTSDFSPKLNLLHVIKTQLR